ncbi:MAG: protein-L-isoaspartate O-methyltransferase family protein [Pseudomonadota bacterium]
MTALNVEQARFNMIEQQVRPWDVLDFRVLSTLRGVRREAFVPEALREQAFSDTMLPLGHGEVMMPPVVEGRMLQALDVQPGETVLEIGTGSGFTAACMAHMGGQVTSVEIHRDLSAAARVALDAQGFGAVSLETGDASVGWDNGRRYDVIAVTGALPAVPEAYKAMLNEGGRLFVIVGVAPVMQAMLMTRLPAGEDGEVWQTESLFETCLPYLVHAQPKPVFTF